jgi:hypothetical protein
MLKHFLAEHGEQKFYPCMYCDKRFCLLTNLRTHTEEVHCTSKDPWRYEWGPEEQQTMNDDYDDDSDEWSDDDDDDGDEKEEKSDHEDHEEHTGDTDPDESGPDSEGAYDRDSDDE